MSILSFSYCHIMFIYLIYSLFNTERTNSIKQFLEHCYEEVVIKLPVHLKILLRR
jgi:hypothetical protein